MHLKIFKEPAGVISAGPIWICADFQGYLYTGDTLFKLLKQVIFEWRNDKHLVG